MESIKVPRGGYFREEDLQEINKLLAKNAESPVRIVAHRGIKQYKAKFEGKEYDVSDKIPLYSPDNVPVNFVRKTYLEFVSGRYEPGEAQVWVITELDCVVANTENSYEEPEESSFKNPFGSIQDAVPEVLSRT